MSVNTMRLRDYYTCHLSLAAVDRSVAQDFLPRIRYDRPRKALYYLNELILIYLKVIFIKKKYFERKISGLSKNKFRRNRSEICKSKIFFSV